MASRERIICKRSELQEYGENQVIKMYTRLVNGKIKKSTENWKTYLIFDIQKKPISLHVRDKDINKIKNIPKNEFFVLIATVVKNGSHEKLMLQSVMRGDKALIDKSALLFHAEAILYNVEKMKEIFYLREKILSTEECIDWKDALVKLKMLKERFYGSFFEPEFIKRENGDFS